MDTLQQTNIDYSLPVYLFSGRHAHAVAKLFSLFIGQCDISSALSADIFSIKIGNEVGIRLRVK
ncbi:MAG: hypothetical protein IPI60_16660 [Saprospiraceae bacterium]|nr:hypothetical protein [Saprospiraceae bacterium]